MINIDLRTIFLNYFITDIVCLIVMFILWQQSRKRFNGIQYLLIDYLFQVICLMLIFMRGFVPDFISIVIANTFAISGAVLGLIGLEHFTGKQRNNLHNYLLIVVFFCIHTYFTFVKPDLAIRNLNTAVFQLIIAFQCAWLLTKRVPSNLRSLSASVGVAFSLYVLVNLMRIVEFFVIKHSATDYFNAGGFETFVIIAYQMLFILLTFTLVLMINKRLLKDIASQEEKFSKAFHSVPYGIIVSRFSDGKLIEVNKGFEDISNYSASESLGKTTKSLNLWHNPNDRKKLTDILLKSGKVTEMECIFINKSGEKFNGIISSEIININNEKCIISVIRDITERKVFEEELKNQAAQLTELNNTKDKFFSIIAHDLKSPFNSIMGLSEIIVEQINNGDYKNIGVFAGSIRQSSQQVMDLLLNLIEWSKSETGRLGFNPESFDFTKQIDDVIHLFNESAKQKDIRLNVEYPQSIIINADKSMISTIMRNLISNAIKFSFPGGVIAIKAAENNNEVKVTISDNGIGISKDNIDNLFLLNKNVSTPGTINEQGTGLGLILCKEFVEEHGGKIWVESDPLHRTKGSTFCFIIPKTRGFTGSNH